MLLSLGCVEITAAFAQDVARIAHVARDRVDEDDIDDSELGYHDFSDSATIEKLKALLDNAKQSLGFSVLDSDYTCGMDRPGGSLLLFRDVTAHADRDPEFRLVRKHQSVKPGADYLQVATFGVVVHGECTLHLTFDSGVPFNSLSLRPGDIYVFDQHTMHAVTDASDICVHISTSVPYQLAENLYLSGFSHKIPQIFERQNNLIVSPHALSEN